jgi:hypothetical protein
METKSEQTVMLHHLWLEGKFIRRARFWSRVARL